MNISLQNLYVTARGVINGLDIAVKAAESGNSLPLEKWTNDTHQVTNGKEALLDKVVKASPDEILNIYLAMEYSQ